VRSIGVDSWALDYVLMGEAGAMLSQPFCYRDARTKVVYVKARAQVGDGVIYGHTGIQFMPINTLYQLIAESQSAERMLEKAGHFLMIGDWIHHGLCGALAQEESNASTTQLWNPVSRRWSEELINAFGLPRRIFPRVVAPCTVLGNLLPELQRETGLDAVKIVAGCVHDTGVAVAAVPARGEAWAYISSGTWSLVGVELSKPLITDEARRANFTNETGVGETSRFLRNASGMWLLQECRRIWKQEGQEFTYDDLSRLASSSSPFRSLINPDDPSFLRPENMPEAIAAFCRKTGQTEPKTPGEFARCVLESLALLYDRILRLARTVTGKAIETVHIIGGGSQSALLNQMTADATGCVVLSGPTEATAIGNILLQALALGEISSHAELREVVLRSFELREFRPAAR
jgi:rhamnulokinase